MEDPDIEEDTRTYYKVALAFTVNNQTGFDELKQFLGEDQDLHIGLITVLVFGQQQDARNLKSYLIDCLRNILDRNFPISFFPKYLSKRHPHNVGGGKTLVIYPQDETPWKCLNSILTSSLTLYNHTHRTSYFLDKFTCSESYKPHMTLRQGTRFREVEEWLREAQSFHLDRFQWNSVPRWDAEKVTCLEHFDIPEHCV